MTDKVVLTNRLSRLRVKVRLFYIRPGLLSLFLLFGSIQFEIGTGKTSCCLIEILEGGSTTGFRMFIGVFL